MFSLKSVLSKKEETKEVVIDLTYLKDFSNNDREFEKELLEISVVDLDEKMKELKTSVSAKNAQRLVQLCHSMKSVFFIIGIQTLHSELKSVEIALLENGFSSSVSERLEAVQEVWTSARAGLEKILKEYK